MAVNVTAAWTERSNLGLLALTLALSVIIWQIAAVIYNIYFHPLRKFPGPLIQRASPLPWCYQHATGVQFMETQKLHDRYGPVVRIGPNHLSFVDTKAWKDIYGHRVGGSAQTSEMSKAKEWVHAIRSAPTSIINADREEHSRFRRALSHGFSDAAMREQEPEIVKYVDLLIERLHQECGQGKEILNIEAWYNWTTFDVVGTLVFGQSFRCLESTNYHPWIEFIFKTIRGNGAVVAMTYLGLGIIPELIYRSGAFGIRKVHALTEDMVTTRLNAKRNDDLFEGLVEKKDEWNLSFKKLSANALILVIAGSETTATTLSGATYLLLTHPEIMEKLKQEVRSAFKDASEININTVNNLKYMLAILNEALRLYPPVSSGLVRKVPAGGAEIAGHFVSEGTFVEVQHWSMNHSKENWSEPWEFQPERFLGTSKEALEAGNRLEALQAFSVGPRNCIGRNLAYAEMRLILARIIFDFDMKMSPKSEDWIAKQRAYTLWDRVPLEVYLTPVRKA
ncbi:isotrichodermin C-15 hydroxylase [Xylaria arbuscula]|nr:isotrichodermin C-15 hydroxylase [Xylaria arbuscula]